MNIKVIVKNEFDKPVGVSVVSQHTGLNMLRRAIVSVARIEETSADLKALHAINEITDSNKVITIENTKMKTKIVFMQAPKELG